MHRTSSSPDPEKSLTHLLEECRMVLPGIQALFGFQLIAVFNNPFRQLLGHAEQIAHFIAMFMVAVSVGLVMAPAAFHRLSEPGKVSERFLRLASWLLGSGMGFLVAGTGIDIYLIGRIIFGNAAAALAFSMAISLVLAMLWFVGPLLRARRQSPSEG
jgi:hypothetical protein